MDPPYGLLLTLCIKFSFSWIGFLLFYKYLAQNCGYLIKVLTSHIRFLNRPQTTLHSMLSVIIWKFSTSILGLLDDRLFQCPTNKSATFTWCPKKLQTSFEKNGSVLRSDELTKYKLVVRKTLI